MNAMLTSHPGMLIIVVLYFIAMAAVGAYFSRAKFQETFEDYAMAGKGLGSLVLIGTFMATWMGGGTVTGGPNSISYNGAFWPAITYSMGSVAAVICLLFIAPVFRRRNQFTCAGLLEECYGKTARIVGGVLVALAAYSIVSYQYRGLGLVLNATTGLSTTWCTLICCVIVIYLAYSGGLKSVAVSDAVSAFIMLIGLALAVPFVLKVVGGWKTVVGSLNPDGLTFTAGWTFKDYLANMLPLFFLALGDQNMWQRMASGSSDKNVKIGMIGWALGIIVCTPIVCVLAYAAKYCFGSNIDAGQALIASATLCPTIVGGLCLSAASAFIITTGDSYLLSGSTTVVMDIVQQIKNKEYETKDLIKYTKICILVFGVIALGLLLFFPSILAIQYWSYTIYGAGITPALIGAAVFPKKVTKQGGLWSIILGGGLTIVWEAFGLAAKTGWATILVACPAAILSLIVISAATQNKPGAKIYQGE